MPKKIYYAFGYEPVSGDPNLLLHLDAGNAASYPGSGATWADISGNGNDFTLNGSFSHNALFGGGCLEFEGAGEYAEFANGNGVFSTRFYTVIVWWYYTGLEQLQGLWSYDFTSYSMPYYAQHMRASNSGLNFQYNRGGTSFWGPFISGGATVSSWHQVAMTSGQDTSDPTKNRFTPYVNGTGSGGEVTVPNAYYDQEVWIGRLTFDNTSNAKFAIVKFYDRELSGSEILADYEENKSRFGLP